MVGEEVPPDWQTSSPRIPVPAHSPLVARAGRSRFWWDEERKSRAVTEEDPAQMMGGRSMETQDTGSHSPPALALPRVKETVMETREMGSVDKGNLKATEAMDLEDKETEKERGGKDPRGPGRAHSESHCCISGPGWGPCGHLGCPKSRADRRASRTQTPPPAPGLGLPRCVAAAGRVCSAASGASSE